MVEGVWRCRTYHSPLRHAPPPAAKGRNQFGGLLGARNQHIVWGWLDLHLSAEITKLAAQGWRVAQVDGYLHLKDGLRFNAVFEQGTHAQQALIGRPQAELDAMWAGWMPKHYRLRHLDITTDAAGQLRYSAVMSPAGQVQRYVAGWSGADIAKAYGEEWSKGSRLSAISMTATPAGPRYAAIWNPDGSGQVVYWRHTRERIREVYDEMWAQGLKLRALSTVGG